MEFKVKWDMNSQSTIHAELSGITTTSKELSNGNMTGRNVRNCTDCSEQTTNTRMSQTLFDQEKFISKVDCFQFTGLRRSNNLPLSAITDLFKGYFHMNGMNPRSADLPWSY